MHALHQELRALTSPTALRTRGRARGPGPIWWQWPTILSLDAPLVCVLWQTMLARVLGVSLGWAHVWVLGASVWLAYAADRWLEGWRVDRDDVRTQRHQFYQRQRWAVAGAWVGVLAADVAIAVARLDRGELQRGLVLLAAVMAYLLSHQSIHRGQAGRAPKEFVVAVLLTAGVALFLIPTWRWSIPLAPFAAFGVVCFINCALISRWERDVDRAQGQMSLALRSARAARLIRWLPWVATGVALVGVPLVTVSERSAVACGAGSALLLALLDYVEPRTGWAVARVLADLSLMTPIVPLLWRV